MPILLYLLDLPVVQFILEVLHASHIEEIEALCDVRLKTPWKLDFDVALIAMTFVATFDGPIALPEPTLSRGHGTGRFCK